MKYTDLIFDLYGTLLDIETDMGLPTWEKIALFFSFHGAHYTGQALMDAFYAQVAQRHLQAGENYECFPDTHFEDIMADLFRAKGITENAQALGFQAAQVDRIVAIRRLQLYPGVLDALRKLRAAGYRLWLLTNAQRVFTQYELCHVGLEGLFDGIYISSDYGCQKPDRRFFRTLLDEQQLNPQKCLMIGNDRRTDIAGAQAVGLDTLYLHTNLTPEDQAPADPAIHPAGLTAAHHMEYEGSDWLEISQLLCQL